MLSPYQLILKNTSAIRAEREPPDGFSEKNAWVSPQAVQLRANTSTGQEDAAGVKTRIWKLPGITGGRGFGFSGVGSGTGPNRALGT